MPLNGTVLHTLENYFGQILILMRRIIGIADLLI